MRTGVKLWLHSILVAFLSGIFTALAMKFTDKELFNLSLFSTAKIVFVAGLAHVFLYLKQSPLPPKQGDTTLFFKKD